MTVNVTLEDYKELAKHLKNNPDDKYSIDATNDFLASNFNRTALIEYIEQALYNHFKDRAFYTSLICGEYSYASWS